MDVNIIIMKKKIPTCYMGWSTVNVFTLVMEIHAACFTDPVLLKLRHQLYDKGEKILAIFSVHIGA